MLLALLGEIDRRHPKQDFTEYTKGYIDCAKYTIEWIEEQDDDYDYGA